MRFKSKIIYFGALTFKNGIVRTCHVWMGVDNRYRVWDGIRFYSPDDVLPASLAFA